MSEAPGSDGAARPAKGLNGRLDAPAEAVPLLTEFMVGGWVVHERLRVERVLVTVNGEVAGHTRIDVPRPDVQQRYPDVHGAGQHGWAVLVPGVSGESATIRAYAHVESGPGDDHARLGPWIRFAEVTLPVVSSGASFGHVDEPHDLTPGMLRVTGRAWALNGLARVELAADDGPWVRARHSQPGVAPVEIPGAWGEPDARLSGFTGYVPAPRSGPLTIRVVAVGLDGHRHPIEPLRVEVGEAPASSLTPVREESLRERFEQRTARLTAVAGSAAPILVAAHSLDLGGAQLYLSLLLDRLRERGLDFIVASRSAGPLLADLEADGIPVLVHGTDPGSREALEGQVLQVAEFAREHGAVGCLANSLPTFPAVIAAQRLGLPTTWAVHESFDLDTFWSEAYGRALPPDVTQLAEKALAGCDDVVFEAESTMRLYDDLVPADRRSLVPYGVDASAVDRFLADSSVEGARAGLGLARDALVLACVGTVEARKGQLALLRAFARIPDELRRGVRFAVVGMNDTAYADAVRRFVEDAGLSDAVVLADVTPDIYPWYLAADILVSASDIESVPRTMLEAMLMGRPVAATAAFGVAELVTDDVTGFLCEPLDLGPLQQLVERVVRTDRARLAEMGRAAREHVLQHHDPAVYVDHFESRLRPWTSGLAD